MGVTELKNECNSKYNQVLDLLKIKGDLNRIHQLLVEIAEQLVLIGNFDFRENERCIKKATFIIKTAKMIFADSKHSSIYYQLTGVQLQSVHGVLESITQDFNQLEQTSKKFKNDKTIDDQSDFLESTFGNGNIRPELLSDYIGQEKIVVQIKEAIEASKIKKKPLEHMLLFGSAGLGKTSLSKIIANEMQSRIIIMSGPTIKDPSSIVPIVKDIKFGDILFIDEIHRISISAAESIYTVMEDFELSYVDKSKEGTINKTLKLPLFTVIGATTHSGMLEKPMRDRFALQFKMDLYSVEELTKIAISSSKQLGKKIDEDAATSIARRSRGVPRICNSFIKRIVDKALVKNVDCINIELVNDYFSIGKIDELGLNDVDVLYMTNIYERFGNKPVGIDNLSSCLGEGKDIIESQIEPYLIYLGFIQITSGGRILTPAGIEYIESK